MYEPKPEHRFTFGPWTVGSAGRDPFGVPVRASLSPVELVHRLTEINADDGSTGVFKGAYSAGKAGVLKTASFDRVALSTQGLGYERLDQLAVDLLLGVR